MLPALQSRNYRLYFIGQGLSLTGTWVTQIATVWLVYQMTQSPLMLGLVSFTTQLPNLVLSPFGGVLVDRWNHRKTLLVTQTLAMLQSFALAALALSGQIQVWQIFGLALLQGLINAVDIPARQAIVPELVEQKATLMNAIALNSSMVTSAKLVGPAIGGLVISAVGAGYCFLIDGCSYAAVLICLLAMRIPVIHRKKMALSPASVWQNLLEGIRYIVASAPIRALLLLVGVVSFLGLSPTVVLPIYAAELGQGAQVLGMLMAAPGVGALLGAVILTRRREIRGLGRWVAFSPMLLGASMIGFAYSNALWFSILMLVLIGLGTLLQSACSNTIVQSMVADDKRGRVMSFYMVAFLGMMALGNLATGSLINLLGISTEVALSGVACILAAVLFAHQLPKLRQQAQVELPVE